MAPSHLLPTPSERVLSTLNEDGSRRWLRPRLSTGRFLHARRWVAWSLVALFATLPFVRVGGAPAVLLDVGKRQFTLFGKTFLPTDTVLLAVLLVAVIVSAFLLTAVLGRVWCGWACPQTVYLEFLYRPIERFFDGPPGRGGVVGRKASPARTVAKYVVFLVASILLANLFLSYFVGVESLWTWVTRSPFEHPTSFAVMASTAALMFINFTWFREQTCIVACPYGRLQSVLLDAESLIVSYDARRGEPRRQRKSPVDQSVSQAKDSTGDCVDCGLCVETCPTGIDIRGGLRMECIGCAQCIDACDAVMQKVKRPPGLIRYSSQARMRGDVSNFWRPRIFAYGFALLLIAGAFMVLILRSNDTDVTVLRGMGSPFSELGDGYVANPVRLKITNRTRAPRNYRVAVTGAPEARILSAEARIEVQPSKSMTRDLVIAIPSGGFVLGRRRVQLDVVDDRNESTQVEYELLGPQQGPTRAPREVPANASQ